MCLLSDIWYNENKKGGNAKGYVHKQGTGEFKKDFKRQRRAYR